MGAKDAQNGQDPQEDKVRLNLWLNPRQYDELKMLARYEGRSVSDIVRQVLSAHLRDNQDVVTKGTKR